MQWEKITDIILIASFAVLAVFACLGLFQWISRKSFKKVDQPLKAFFPPLILAVLTYIIFDKFIILSTRPDGSGEPSFPSSHTMLVATIFFCVILALPKYVKNKPTRFILTIIMLALVALTAVGRVAANKHWPTDVICGLVFAAVFSSIYYFFAKKSPKKSNHQNHKEPTHE